MGYNSLWKNSTGNFNTGIGQSALFQNTGSNNTGIGVNVIQGNSTGSNNVGLGYNAGVFDMNNLNTSVFDNSVFLGANSKMHADGETNQIVIGYNAIGNGSNTIQLGNTSISNVKTSGTLTTGTITLPNTDGTSGQVLSTNGSGSVGWANSTISGINIDQTNNNVAIGNYAGQTNQAANSVAIGNSAGQTNQGTNAIAIGNYAGNNNQQANSIILNATGSTLDATSNSGFFVSPIRSNISSQPVLTYNTTTNEISSNSAKTFVINHPTKPDSYLVHACLEGPEAGVY